jgi:Transcriptional regulator PadR-like family
MIGEFEYLVLTAAIHLDEDAYGAAIRREIEAATEHRCFIGALYTTLDRLETKGFVKTWMGDSTPQRGRSGQANGLRNSKGDSRRFRLLSCGHASEPECLMGGRFVCQTV